MNNFEFSENQEVGFKKDTILDDTLKYSRWESAWNPNQFSPRFWYPPKVRISLKPQPVLTSFLIPAQGENQFETLTSSHLFSDTRSRWESAWNPNQFSPLFWYPPEVRISLKP
jgi:hypothetical protein